VPPTGVKKDAHLAAPGGAHAAPEAAMLKLVLVSASLATVCKAATPPAQPNVLTLL
jgi:hypothetical protein